MEACWGSWQNWGYPPRPEQMAGIWPVGIALDEPPAKGIEEGVREMPSKWGRDTSSAEKARVAARRRESPSVGASCTAGRYER